MTDAEFEARYLTRLNVQQRLAVTTVDGAVLLLAVPGSGKTTVLVNRLGYMLLVKNIPAEQIFVMTYTVAATREMRSRFTELFGSACDTVPEFRTINGLCSTVINYYSRYFGKAEPFRLQENEAELTALLRSVYREINQDYPSDSTLRELRTQITYIKNMLLDEEEIAELDTSLSHLPELYTAYCTAMTNARWMDYDDQLVLALKIFKARPEVLSYFRSRFRYFCVDEAQDTSKIQHTIIRLLAEESGNLFMVGDEDQSIYGFRAAYPDALLYFRQEHPGAQVLRMEENFRSTPEIVSAADAFIAANSYRTPKKMHTSRPAGEAVSFLPVRNRTAQFEKLFQIAEQGSAGTAVLVRNNDSAVPLIDRLERSGVRYSCRRFDETFFSHRVVCDVRDFLQFAAEPSNRELFLRIYYKADCGITAKLAELVCARSSVSGKDILTELLSVKELKPYQRENIAEWRRQLRRIPAMDGESAVHCVWEGMKYGRFVEKNGLDAGKQEILALLGRHESNASGLLRRLEELRILIRNHENLGGITVSTVHSAKGLEYDTVYLADVLDGILPVIGKKEAVEQGKLREYEEERRIFYVAMTRARKKLYLFDIASEKSAFVSEIKKLRRPILPAKPKYVPPEPITDARLRAMQEAIVPGAEIYHRKFEWGTVVRLSGESVLISFPCFEDPKRFLLQDCLKKGILRLPGF